MLKFEIGKDYVRPGLFSSNFKVRVVARTEKTASFVQVGWEEEPPVEIVIEVQDNEEVCECWDYMEHKGYIKAGY